MPIPFWTMYGWKYWLWTMYGWKCWLATFWTMYGWKYLLATLWTMYGQRYFVPATEYMTLRPDFFCCSISGVYPSKIKPFSKIPEASSSSRRVLCYGSVKTWFKAFCAIFVLSSVFRLFTPPNHHLMSSFNKKNDQCIKAHLLASFPTIVWKNTIFGFSCLGAWLHT